MLLVRVVAGDESLFSSMIAKLVFETGPQTPRLRRAVGWSKELDVFILLGELGDGETAKTLSTDSVSESSLLRAHAGNCSFDSSKIVSKLGNEALTLGECNDGTTRRS